MPVGSRCEALPRWQRWWRACLQCRRHRRCGFWPGVGKISWRRTWRPIALLLPAESATEEPGGRRSTGLPGVRHAWSNCAHAGDAWEGKKRTRPELNASGNVQGRFWSSHTKRVSFAALPPAGARRFTFGLYRHSWLLAPSALPFFPRCSPRGDTSLWGLFWGWLPADSVQNLRNFRCSGSPWLPADSVQNLRHFRCSGSPWLPADSMQNLRHFWCSGSPRLP